MKHIPVVIFPETLPDPQVLTPLVLVFEPVVYCQPVESDDSGDSADTASSPFIAHSLCKFNAPAPLNENRERFLHLVNDLRIRQDDYAAQLTHVSIAGISTGSQPGTEQKSSILSNLLSGQGIESSDEELKEKLLWQARLVLKLGEQYDAEQNKVNEDLYKISQREQSLFGGLVKEEKKPFSLTENIHSLTPDSNGMQHLRLKAWARIFAFGSSSVSERCFVSRNPDAVDRLCEEYERISGRRPIELSILSLPARNNDDKEYFKRLEQFRQDRAEVCEKLSAMLDSSTPGDSGLQDSWNAAVDEYFPTRSYDRCQIILYGFHDVQVKQLFLDSFGHDEDELEAELVEENRENVVIGLLC